MFGMTKRQFLKRSKKCLRETGTLLLSIRVIMDKEVHGKIDNQEALKQMDNIRKNIEIIFEEFEKRNPPSRCASLKKRILRILINLNEAVNANYKSLLAAENGNTEESKEKLKESRKILEEFRTDFHRTVEEVDTLLQKKQRRII
ncbi:hypothetical protein [Methanobacterium oryzae]|uniref:hypothetical protein n=1 Tax=Methanobacterium oryzae TaxID=69540 RepID=UPI003D1BCCDB